MKNPTAIITGDIHLRDDQPVCRTDDYFQAQAQKIKWLLNLQEEHGCPILDAGDLFAKSKPSHYLVQWAINNLPYSDMYTVPGNHDLPSHNLELLDKSGLGVLVAAQAIQVIMGRKILSKNFVVDGFPWGKEPKGLQGDGRGELPHVALCHVMTFDGESPWPGCKDLSATKLLRRMSGYDLVITGHNHKAFVVQRQGRLLVNPGSLMRSNAEQADFKPRVYLWYAEDNTVEPIYVPIEEDVVSREHLDVVKDKDERIDAFVTKLSGDFDVSLSFEKNLEQFFSTNRIRSSVKDLVWESVKGE